VLIVLCLGGCVKLGFEEPIGQSEASVPDGPSQDIPRGEGPAVDVGAGSSEAGDLPPSPVDAPGTETAPDVSVADQSLGPADLGQPSADAGCSVCLGCCDTSGVCRPGNTDHACGMGGASCMDCTVTGGVCVNGACAISACGPANCSGCCAQGVCVPLASQTDNKCGSGGAACVICRAMHLCCPGYCAAICP
jgi:hypothetical protein